ncbi:MAG: c-type cytochrome [Dehalococcoidia bacterium]
MNTNKQINIMLLMVFASVVLTGAYWLIDPDRASSARDRQLEATIERGAWLYAQNCRVCHGNTGEGGGASNRLRAAPPLNRPDLRGVGEDGFETALLTQAYDLVFDTITCGRVGRAMPTWGQSQGGTLNEEQIKQLTTFITQAVHEEELAKAAAEAAEGSEENGEEEEEAEPENAWEIAEIYAFEGVPEFDLHSPDTQDELHLAESIDANATELTLTSPVVNPAEATGEGLRLQMAEELMLVLSVDAETGVVTVERGLGTTDPAPHEAGTFVVEPPVPPDPPAITERACGQTASAVPTAAPEPPSAELTIVASGTAWNKTQLFALPDGPLTLTVDNQDDGIAHNIVFFEGAEPGGDEIVRTDIENGPVTQTLNFGPLAVGDYFYYCEVHPNMEGVLTAGTADQSGDAAGEGSGAEDPVTTDPVVP